MGQQLKELWAFVVTDLQGNEDVLIGSSFTPMIGNTREGLERFREDATRRAESFNMTLKAACFERKEPNDRG